MDSNTQAGSGITMVVCWVVLWFCPQSPSGRACCLATSMHLKSTLCDRWLPLCAGHHTAVEGGGRAGRVRPAWEHIYLCLHCMARLSTLQHVVHVPTLPDAHNACPSVTTASAPLVRWSCCAPGARTPRTAPILCCTRCVATPFAAVCMLWPAGMQHVGWVQTRRTRCVAWYGACVIWRHPSLPPTCPCHHPAQSVEHRAVPRARGGGWYAPVRVEVQASGCNVLVACGPIGSSGCVARRTGVMARRRSVGTAFLLSGAHAA